jgi:hypothetical protein
LESQESACAAQNARAENRSKKRRAAHGVVVS